MSHITAVKTEITDLDAAEEALRDLGFDTARNAFIQVWMGRSVHVDLAACRVGNKWAIGLEKSSDGTYNIVADWAYVWEFANIPREKFTKSFLQRYAYVKVKKLLDEQGFRVVTEEVDEQKSIRLEVTKWR